MAPKTLPDPVIARCEDPDIEQDICMPRTPVNKNLNIS